MTAGAEDGTHDRAVAGMFGRIASFYDLGNHVLSFGADFHWRRVLARHVDLRRTGRVLDLAAGTLDVSLAIRRRLPEAEVLAMDFCPPMLERGLRKLRGGSRRAILPVAADARHLPLPDVCADCVTMAFGIRNITPRAAAFAEMLRVLVPGGRACILEFGSGRERIWFGLYNLYLRAVLPLLGRLCSGDRPAYDYLARTIREFPPADELADEMRAAGFARVTHMALSSGIVRLHVAEKGGG